MALGLIGAALSGGAEAANEIADNSLEKKRQRALLELKDKYSARDAERRHDYRSQELEQGHVFDQENTQLTHDLALEIERYRQGQQNYRASLPGGGSRGYAPGGLEKDVEYFKSQGYSQDEAEQRVLALRGRSDNPIEGLESTVESIDAMLSDHNLLANMSDEDIEGLQADRQAAWSRLQELRQRAYNYGAGNRNTPPQEGDIVGNPDPSDGADAPVPPADNPPPTAPRDPDAEADDILRQFGL